MSSSNDSNTPSRESARLFNPFGALGSMAAKWGVSDFYEDHEKALRQTIESGRPFDTEVYSVKKEIEWGRVKRDQRGGPIVVTVIAAMDDPMSLLDTKAWEITKERLPKGSPVPGDGREGLMAMGMDQGQVTPFMLAVLREHYSAEQVEQAAAQFTPQDFVDALKSGQAEFAMSMIPGDLYDSEAQINRAERSSVIDGDADMDAVVAALNELCGQCDQELEKISAALKATAIRLLPEFGVVG